jgi:hypothetical protein
MAFRYRLIVLLSVVWVVFAGIFGGAIEHIRGGTAWRTDGTCGPHQFEWQCKPPDPGTGFGMMLVPPLLIGGLIALIGWTVTGK